MRIKEEIINSNKIKLNSEKLEKIYEIINSDKYSNQYKKLLVGVYLPIKNNENFTYFKNKYKDKENFIINNKNNLTDKQIYQIVNYLNNNKMYYIKKNNKYLSDKELIDEFINLELNNYHLSDNKKRNYILGRYAELYVYYQEYNKNKNNNDIEIIWVANDIGDGFGYDLMKYNHKTKETTLIEVKSKEIDLQSKDILLTNNESNTIDLIEEEDYVLKSIEFYNNEEPIIYNYIYDKKNNDFIVKEEHIGVIIKVKKQIKNNNKIFLSGINKKYVGDIFSMEKVYKKRTRNVIKM